MFWKKWLDPGYYELRRLKTEVAAGPFVEENPLGYTIRVVRRGEALLYIEGERALLIAVDLSLDKVFSDSISCWDNGSLLSSTDKNVVIDRVVSYMLNFQKVTAVVV
jgi:hypothetical protein